MPLNGELFVGFFYIVGRCVALHAENGVVVFLGAVFHCFVG